MSDLTERAREVVRAALMPLQIGDYHAGRIAVKALAEAGMLTDPDAEDPRIAAARTLCDEFKADARKWTQAPDGSLALAYAASKVRAVLDGDRARDDGSQMVLGVADDEAAS